MLNGAAFFAQMWEQSRAVPSMPSKVISYICALFEYRRQCTKFNGTSYISQRAAEAIYTPEGKEQVKATIDYYMQNAHTMKQTLKDLGLEVYGGEHAPYLWVKTPEGMNSWRFFEQMLYDAHVVCTPGVGFGPSGEGYVRFTAFGSHEKTTEALNRITQWSKK